MGPIFPILFTGQYDIYVTMSGEEKYYKRLRSPHVA